MSEGVLEPPRRSGGRGRVAAGVVGGLVGLAAAGVAAGLAAERTLLRRQKRVVGHDPYADEPFGELPADEYRTIVTAEGVPLHVEITAPRWGTGGQPRRRGAEVTVVFIHGFCLDMGTFHFQRQALSRVEGVRTVSYDQPGHGRSGRLEKGEYTLEMLASALRKVIEECAPRDGAVVLFGHSMGGMAIMALADLVPELFTGSGRVAGVVLANTSAGGVTFGLPEVVVRFRGRLLPLISGAGTATATVLDRARASASDLAWLLTRRYGFGSEGGSPALVSYVEQMITATSTESVARYMRALYSHDREPGLPVLKPVPVLLIAGEQDRVTPVEHSRAIARALPHAELAVIPGAGHVALVERGDDVNAVLLPFVRRIGA
ncbi:MAG TPA: alpha/beta hydrolase [Micromonosporaceae bacterium]|jgi:pimeloyl-ACP methyl ester carboxylesterase